jgi:hypothetical protein
MARRRPADLVQSYRSFWPFYVSQHLHRTNRRLHFVGTTLVIACGLLAVVRSPRYLLLMPFAGYGFAWAGHYFYEKNRPATFSQPVLSLIGDFHMFWLTLTGEMESVVRAVEEDLRKPAEPEGAGAAAAMATAGG